MVFVVVVVMVVVILVVLMMFPTTTIIAAGGHRSILQGGYVPLRSHGHRRVHDWQTAGDLGFGV